MKTTKAKTPVKTAVKTTKKIVVQPAEKTKNTVKRVIKGTTKIMVNREGVPRIQEELNGQIRVFSLDDWNAELERRINSKSEVVEPTGNTTENHDNEEDEGTGKESGKTLIQEDNEDDDAGTADRSL